MLGVWHRNPEVMASDLPSRSQDRSAKVKPLLQTVQEDKSWQVKTQGTKARGCSTHTGICKFLSSHGGRGKFQEESGEGVKWSCRGWNSGAWLGSTERSCGQIYLGKLTLRLQKMEGREQGWT